MEIATGTEAGTGVTARRARRGKKRLVFQPPSQMPPGVQDLWNHATAEERERAHRTMVVMLEVWLAKTDAAGGGGEARDPARPAPPALPAGDERDAGGAPQAAASEEDDAGTPGRAGRTIRRG